jgi:hypothetical protein
MAITLVGLPGAQRGVEFDEVGINIKTFEPAYKPEFKEFMQNKTNEKCGFAVAETEVEITVEGEVIGSTGLMAAGFTTAVTLANDTDEFGASAGGIYMDSANVKQARDGWRDVSFKFSKNALIS